MRFSYMDAVYEDLRGIDPVMGSMILDYFEKNYHKGEELADKKTHKGCVLYTGRFRFIYDVYLSKIVVHRVINE